MWLCNDAYCVAVLLHHQVIPPLRGSDDGFFCRHCDTELLRASSILHHSAGKSPAPPEDFAWLYPDPAAEDEDEEGTDADMGTAGW